MSWEITICRPLLLGFGRQHESGSNVQVFAVIADASSGCSTTVATWPCLGLPFPIDASSRITLSIFEAESEAELQNGSNVPVASACLPLDELLSYLPNELKPRRREIWLRLNAGATNCKFTEVDASALCPKVCILLHEDHDDIDSKNPLPEALRPGGSRNEGGVGTRARDVPGFEARLGARAEKASLRPRTPKDVNTFQSLEPDTWPVIPTPTVQGALNACLFQYQETTTVTASRNSSSSQTDSSNHNLLKVQEIVQVLHAELEEARRHLAQRDVDLVHFKERVSEQESAMLMRIEKLNREIEIKTAEFAEQDAKANLAKTQLERAETMKMQQDAQLRQQGIELWDALSEAKQQSALARRNSVEVEAERSRLEQTLSVLDNVRHETQTIKGEHLQDDEGRRQEICEWQSELGRMAQGHHEQVEALLAEVSHLATSQARAQVESQSCQSRLAILSQEMTEERVAAERDFGEMVFELSREHQRALSAARDAGNQLAAARTAQEVGQAEQRAEKTDLGGLYLKVEERNAALTEELAVKQLNQAELKMENESLRSTMATQQEELWVARAGSKVELLETQKALLVAELEDANRRGEDQVIKLNDQQCQLDDAVVAGFRLEAAAAENSRLLFANEDLSANVEEMQRELQTSREKFFSFSTKYSQEEHVILKKKMHSDVVNELEMRCWAAERRAADEERLHFKTERRLHDEEAECARMMLAFRGVRSFGSAENSPSRGLSNFSPGSMQTSNLVQESRNAVLELQMLSEELGSRLSAASSAVHSRGMLTGLT